MHEALGAEDAAALEQRLRALPDLPSLLLRLDVGGTLDLTARADLEQRRKGVEAALFWLAWDLGRLHVRPTAEDLEQIDFHGVLREAAERLRGEAEDLSLPAARRRRAEEALVQLFVMTRDARGQAA